MDAPRKVVKMVVVVVVDGMGVWRWWVDVIHYIYIYSMSKWSTHPGLHHTLDGCDVTIQVTQG